MVFHHLGKGTLGHAQGVQGIQVRDQIHPAFPRLDEFHGVFLAQRVLKDDALQSWHAGGIPIGRMRFQDDAVRTFVRLREAFHQLVWARAPRASALDNSPALLPPAEFAIELAIAEMHVD